MTSSSPSSPIRLKIDMGTDDRKGDTAFQWPEEQRKYWIVAMFCGTLLLYAARSAVPLCMAAMSSDMNWDKEIDVSLTIIQQTKLFMLYVNVLLKSTLQVSNYMLIHVLYHVCR